MNNVVALAVLSTLSAAAMCGDADTVPSEDVSPSPAANATQGKPACELLTAQDVEAIFGAPARPNDEQNRNSQCTYWAAETGAAGITLRLTPAGEFESSWASEGMRGMSDIQDIDELGEAAVWVADMRTLVVLAGDQTHVLLGAGMLDPKRQLMERILARR